MSGAAFSWASKLQNVVALSSIEAEYVGLSMAARESLWLHRLIDIMGLISRTGQCPITLWAGNQGSIKLVQKNYQQEEH